MSKINRFLQAENGATSVEYCFMAALIIFACIVGITLFGESTLNLFQTSNTELNTTAFGN